jgi:hypothetical protein
MPIETAVKDHHADYYEAIAKSSTEGNSTPFIEFMLMVILEAALSLEKLVSRRARPIDRIAFMMKHIQRSSLARNTFSSWGILPCIPRRET